MILSSGVVVVRQENKKWKYLFLRAYRNWDFPKGVGETGEDSLDTAKREVREETGISDLHFRWGHLYKETEPYGSGEKKVARYYIAETRTKHVTFSVNPELGRPEHHEYRWVTYTELKKLAPDRLKDVVKWAHGTVSGRSE